jgi:hypothetical protein
MCQRVSHKKMYEKKFLGVSFKSLKKGVGSGSALNVIDPQHCLKGRYRIV